MKRINIVLFLIVATIFGINAQTLQPSINKYCDLGITFEISSTPGWGYGEPVILTVEPFSTAEKSGLRPGDIIMEINQTATYLRNYQTIANWIYEPSSSEIKFSIRNISSYFKPVTAYRECKRENSLSESSLAAAYSFYSIEDTNKRAFSIPMKVDPNVNVDFSDYHTFNFVSEGKNVPEVDSYINSYIEKALLERGLKRDTKDPDILVQSYYTYQPNVKYISATNSENLKSWRVDPEKQEMIKLPILSAEDPNLESKGKYILELGIRFFDKKYINKKKLTQIWDCKTREFLTDQFDLQEYAHLHAPLMLMQYPYAKPKTIAKYEVSFKKFNYTGMNFDATDMKTITHVDKGSPAERAGIRPGDVVVKINNLNFNYSMPELENGYRRFIVETMHLRDKRTRFIDAKGFPDCMYWNKSAYAQVAEAFTKEALYTPAFSYLYSFERYVAGATNNVSLSVQLKTASGSTKNIRIVPEIQQSKIIRTL